MNYLKWNPSKYSDSLTLKEVYEEFKQFTTTNNQQDIPLIVQFFENPKYDIYRFNKLKGSIDLFNHDILHILLNQKMDLKGEAFVIGYTMGNTKSNSHFEILSYKFASSVLFPKSFRFNKNDLKYFDKGYHLGSENKKSNIHKINFKNYFRRTLKELREDFL